MAAGALLCRRAGMAPRALLLPRLVLVAAAEGWLVASPAPLVVRSLLRVPGSPAPSRRPSPGTTAAPSRICCGSPCSPGSHTTGDRSSRWPCAPHPGGGSPAGAEACRQGLGWQGASPSCGGDTGNFDQAFRLVSSIKGEALAGWSR